MLSQIAAKKQQRVLAQKKNLPLRELKAMIKDLEPLRPFAEALQQPGVSIIAEIKKASPSKGNFGLTLPPARLARQYEAAGAQAISVLTEQDYFMGSATDLTDVQKAVTLPVLRKDFIIDPYQLYESRLLCADAVLLIVSLLNTDTLKALLELAYNLGLAVLTETHDENEIALALNAGAQIIGINNRNLQTFVTHISQTERLAPRIPKDRILVSESGILTAADIQKVTAAGAQAVLIGEALVTAKNPYNKIKELQGA